MIPSLSSGRARECGGKYRVQYVIGKLMVSTLRLELLVMRPDGCSDEQKQNPRWPPNILNNVLKSYD